jgi:ankyrin repeat protein
MTNIMNMTSAGGVLKAALASLLIILPLAGSANPDLARSAEKGMLDDVRQMLKAGVDVNSRLNDGSTALHWQVLIRW